MERKLISGNRLLLNTILAIAFSALFSYLLVNIIQHGLQRRYVITSLTLLPALTLITWWAFSAAHPVYFNRDYLYYTRYGKKYRIACEEINYVSVLKAHYCELKFYNHRKKVKSIHFALIPDADDPYLLLNQLETIIKRTKPAFEANGLH